MLFSCKPTKYVPSGKYLLNQVKVKVDNKRINHDELKSYIRQKPNKRILGFLGLRLYLGLYNLSDIHKDNGINKYLRKEGEAPVIWDLFATKKDLNQLKLFMSNKGYYKANVSDTLIFKKNKVDIVYHIKANKPYTVRSIKYTFEDTLIQPYVYADTVNSLIKRGALFDRDVLDNERTRLEYFLKNNGFYSFNRDAISYDADTSMMKVDLMLNIKNRIRTVNNQIVPFRQYKIDKVVVKSGLIKTDTSRMVLDSLSQNGIQIIYYQRTWVNPGTILQSNYIDPGTLYKVSNVDETKSHLLSLNVFNTPNIQFKRSTRNDTSQFNYLDCQIQLSLLDSIQSFGVEVDGTNSDGNFGGALNLIYQHRSLFRNAENFNLKLRGASEAVKRTDKPQFHYTLEYGADATLKIPKFLLPFNSIRFKKKYDPKTSFSISYNYNQRPDFTQTLANISFGYNWKVGPFVNQILKPISINYVNYDHVDSLSPYFKNVSGTYFENIIKNHIVSALNYSLIFKNQKPNKTTDFRYFRWNFEVAGNLLYLHSQLNHETKNKNGSYTLYRIPYSQYILNELDFHHFHVVNEASRIVYRLYAGLGYPYGNSSSLPYEKSFFSGRANSLRCWQALTLGPGSYVDSISKYPNSTGDIKLEANIEYRFKLPWVLEGAMFADAGNIWAIRPDVSRQGASFEWNKFYKDIAISTGIGLRFDFHYFLFRVDVGMKTRNPASNISNPWIFNQHRVYFMAKKKGVPSDFAICGAINYPF